ncbi:MAG: hypothetical protein IMZ69_02575 [Spirochaetes bacterium]|nr:hypothetical protein [Spirochaetota bacterium]
MNFLSPSILESQKMLKQAFLGRNKSNGDRFCTTLFSLGAAIYARAAWTIQEMLDSKLPVPPEGIHGSALCTVLLGLAQEVISFKDPRLASASDLVNNDEFSRGRTSPSGNHMHALGAVAYGYLCTGLKSLHHSAPKADLMVLVQQLYSYQKVKASCGSPCQILKSAWWREMPSCDPAVWKKHVPDGSAARPHDCARGASGILAKQVCMAGGRHEDTIVVLAGSPESEMHDDLKEANFLRPYPKLHRVPPPGQSSHAAPGQ